jgi:hypothetical protein
LSDLKVRACAVRAEDDVTTEIGGAIDLTAKVDFYDLAAAIQIVSSAAADTTQSVTISYRDAASNLLTEAKTLNGRTPVAVTAVPERLMKAVKSATCAGVVAVEAVTAEHTGTPTAGSADTLTLDAGASAVDDYYAGMVVRITAGTGQYDINQAIAYNGTTKALTFAFPASTALDATSVFRISKGMVFDKAPNEILTVTRVLYNVSFPAPGSSSITSCDKFFIKNSHASLDGTIAQALESLDASGLFAFAVAATLDDTATNGAGNTRLIAPGLTFSSAAKAMANAGVLTHGTAQGVWVQMTLAAGGEAIKTTWVPEAQVTTV